MRLARGIGALLPILLWRCLFPNLRDCLGLCAMPVSTPQIFLAKSGALLLAFAVFVLAFNLPWAMLFAAVTYGHWQENPSLLPVVAANFAATGGALNFVFFSPLARQGVPLQCFARPLFSPGFLVCRGHAVS